MLHSIIKAPLLAGFLLAATAASAQMPDVPELPDGWDIPNITPIPGGSLSGLTADEIGGAWSYETSGHAVIACDFPVWPLEPARGDLEIAPHDGVISATLVTGGNCAPDSMCLFEGSFSGSLLALANRDVVDDEGGVAANGWAVAFTGPASAEGTGTSVYVHPEGARCLWSYAVHLSR